MMRFKNVFITAHLAANSRMGGKLEQKISQYVVAIYLKSILMTHVSVQARNQTGFKEFG